MICFFNVLTNVFFSEKKNGVSGILNCPLTPFIVQLQRRTMKVSNCSRNILRFRLVIGDLCELFLYMVFPIPFSLRIIRILPCIAIITFVFLHIFFSILPIFFFYIYFFYLYLS